MLQSRSSSALPRNLTVTATILLLLTALMAPALVAGQSSDTQHAADALARRARLIAIRARISATAPRRRDGPLRVDNIHDYEVREIQALAKVALPGTIVNISGVVTGCPCEDGAKCTDQVWVLGQRPSGAQTLEVSKIDGRWMIGPVQSWWFEAEKLEFRRKAFSSPEDFNRALVELTERFPACLKPQSTTARTE